jgi:hypothetical protein
MSRFLPISAGVAIAVTTGILALASPAAAEVVTLVCDTTSVGGTSAQTYIVDLSTGRVTARPGNLEGNGYGALPADVSDSNIIWRLTFAGGVITRRIDRNTGNVSAWMEGRWVPSGWFCHPAQKVF